MLRVEIFLRFGLQTTMRCVTWGDRLTTQTSEVARAQVSRRQPKRTPVVGLSPNSSAAMLLGLQRSAGNAAVARQLAIQRSSAGRRGYLGALELQRCGPTPCDCSDEERADYAEKRLEEKAYEPDAESPETAQAPVQRCAGVDDSSGSLAPVQRLVTSDRLRARVSPRPTMALAADRVARTSVLGRSSAGAGDHRAGAVIEGRCG
jgi:hypothetical protein